MFLLTHQKPLAPRPETIDYQHHYILFNIMLIITKHLQWLTRIALKAADAIRCRRPAVGVTPAVYRLRLRLLIQMIAYSSSSAAGTTFSAIELKTMLALSHGGEFASGWVWDAIGRTVNTRVSRLACERLAARGLLRRRDVGGSGRGRRFIYWAITPEGEQVLAAHLSICSRLIRQVLKVYDDHLTS